MIWHLSSNLVSEQKAAHGAAFPMCGNPARCRNAVLCLDGCHASPAAAVCPAPGLYRPHGPQASDLGRLFSSRPGTATVAQATATAIGQTMFRKILAALLIVVAVQQLRLRCQAYVRTLLRLTDAPSVTASRTTRNTSPA